MYPPFCKWTTSVPLKVGKVQILKVWRTTSHTSKVRKSFEMDLPCFLLSWLRNLQLIPLTQSQAETTT